VSEFDDQQTTDYLRDVSVAIVDDQKFTANMLRQMVRVLGCMDIQVFTNAESAWTYFKHNRIDMFILDWEMTPDSGLKLTKLIRTSPETPNAFVPIIMVTAYRDKEHVFRARDAGVTEYVIKPVSPKALFSRIEAVIERPRRFVRVGDYFGPDRRRHHTAYDGDDRRGKDAPPQDAEAAAQEKKRDMQQDEINKTFNPDDDVPDNASDTASDNAPKS